MQVVLLQLLAAVKLAIISACVGFRLDIFRARYDLDTIPRRLFQKMQVALLQLLAAVYLAIMSAGVGFRLGIFPVRYNFDTFPRRLFQINAGGTTAASCRSLFRDNVSWRGFQAGHLPCPLRFCHYSKPLILN